MAAAYLARGILAIASIAIWGDASAFSVPIVAGADADEMVDAHSLLQSMAMPHVAGAHRWRDGDTEIAGKETPVRAQPETKHADDWSGALRAIVGVLTVSIAWLALVLLQAAGEDGDSDTAARLHVKSSPGIIVETCIAFAATSTMFTDSAAAAFVVPLLPELCGDRGAALLVVMRPIIASATAIVLLPALMPRGVAWGHFITSFGLLILAVSCLCFATATSPVLLLAGQLMHAIASATIFVSVISTRIHKAHQGRIGLHLGTVLGSSALGYACAPWIGHNFYEISGMPVTFVILAWFSAFACCLHVCIFKHSVGSPTSVERTVVKDVANHADTASKLQTMTFSLLTQKRLMLLCGVALGAAALAVHSIALPLYLQSVDKVDVATLSLWQGAASCAFVFAILSAGTAFDYLDICSVIFCMVVALVLSILGLRFLVMPSAKHCLIPIGLIASLGGVGLYLGLAFPLFAALTSHGSNSAAHRGPTGKGDAMASGMLGAAWFFGDALGVGGQLLLCPLAGVKLTILVFACALALHAIAIALWPGWRMKAGLSTEGALDIQQWLEASGSTKDV